jgi:hypothetical protein
MGAIPEKLSMIEAAWCVSKCRRDIVYDIAVRCGAARLTALSEARRVNP